MTNRVYGIRLNPRQAWVWQRLGNQQIRDWLAPPGICVECRGRKAQSNTRNSWFCYICQDSLNQQDLLPPSDADTLLAQNQQLRAEISKLQTRLQAQQPETATPSVEQLSLPT